MKRPPAFQFNVHDYRSSRPVQRMTYAQRGMYLEMLCEQWDKGSLPDCPRACAELLGGTDQEWIENWPTLRRNFVDRRNRPRKEHADQIPTDFDAARRIVNVRLERYRRSLRALKNERSEAGRRGGRAKAQKLRGIVASFATANPSKHLANPSTETETKTETSTKTETETKAARAGAFCQWYEETHQRLFGVGYMGSGKDYQKAMELVEKFTDEELRDGALVWFGMDDAFATSGTRTVPKFASRITGCLQEARARGIA